jgi:hypothetical protein
MLFFSSFIMSHFFCRVAILFSRVDHVAFICAADYDKDEDSPNYQQKAQTFLNHDLYNQSHPATMLGAGFLFAHANIFRDAPFDKYEWMFVGNESSFY